MHEVKETITGGEFMELETAAEARRMEKDIRRASVLFPPVTLIKK